MHDAQSILSRNPCPSGREDVNKGDTVQLLGFGNFSISDRAERAGRNPSTGEAITIKATAGKALTDAVNAAS